jgi:hypothetical protein
MKHNIFDFSKMEHDEFAFSEMSWEVFRWTAMKDFGLNIDAILEAKPWENNDIR